MKTTLVMTAMTAAALTLADSHVSAAQDREANAKRLFEVSEQIQRSGPCGDLPHLWLTDENMIALLDSLLSGKYDDSSHKLPQYVACFEHQRAVINIRMVIDAAFSETNAALMVAEKGRFTEADIDEFIWLLEGTVRPAAGRKVTLNVSDRTAATQNHSAIRNRTRSEVVTRAQAGDLAESSKIRIPRHKPAAPKGPSVEAVAALLESLEKEIRESDALVSNGVNNPLTSPRKSQPRAGPAPRRQQQIQAASALAQRARAVREGRGNNGVGVRRRAFAPSSNEIRRASAFEPISISEVEAIRLHFQGCWVPPRGLRNAQDLIVTIRFGLFPDGSLRTGPTIVEQSRLRSSDFRAAAEAAQRAVQECTPLEHLPNLSYEQWRSIELAFDPRALPG